MNIESVPSQFQPSSGLIYPDHNVILFENYFHNQFRKNKDKAQLSATYLPIHWTNYYINNNYGANIKDLDEFLNTLDKERKYFTIVQYDDGIINSAAKNLNLYVIAQGTTKNSDYVIPLNCLPGPNIREQEKNIFCFFAGRYTTHPIRHRLKSSLEHNKDYLFTQSGPYQMFSETLGRSLFCLCPRGYGETSFRVCEALQRGSIPVYISDVFAIPFRDQISFEEYGVLIHETEIKDVDKILKSLSNKEIQTKLANGKETYSKYYDFFGCYNSLFSYLEKKFKP